MINFLVVNISFMVWLNIKEVVYNMDIMLHLLDKQMGNGFWLVKKMNDSSVAPVGKNQALNSNPYMLFYIR